MPTSLPSPTTLASTPSSSSRASKSPRVLACVLCQQRKIKCDRKFPCINCTRSQVQCISRTTQPPRYRKKRFAERELLARLRTYEHLLRENDVNFEPLHKDPTKDENELAKDGNYDTDEGEVEGSSLATTTTVKSERVYEAKNLWNAMSRGFRELDSDSDSSHEDVREIMFKDAWSQLRGNDDYLLFGSRRTIHDLSIFHPNPVEIFRLWQIYLDNVNPLLKVTHTPTLQIRVIEAAGIIQNINPNLEGLMFSIYCLAIQSITDSDCLATFHCSKYDLLAKYQFAAQQALLNCNFLRTNDRECLTALYFYLLSIRPSTVPQSLSALLGLTIRIAQRLGMHTELALTKRTPLEAELHRRLWWSLVLFDSRINEISGSKNGALSPEFSCRVPLNINDSDLRPDMKEPPPPPPNRQSSQSSEAIFVVVRAEMANFVRHTKFHCEYTNPSRGSSSTSQPAQEITPEEGEMKQMEKLIEEKYLQRLDPNNPLHFLTTHMARSHIAKYLLMEWQMTHPHPHPSSATTYSSTSSSPSTQPSNHTPQDDQEIPTQHALTILCADTHLMISSLCTPYTWFTQLYFPFPAYIHLVQYLRRHHSASQLELGEKAWRAMSENYEARFGCRGQGDAGSGKGGSNGEGGWGGGDGVGQGPFVLVFARAVLGAWDAWGGGWRKLREENESESVEEGKDREGWVPRIVEMVRERIGGMKQETGRLDEKMDVGIDMNMGNGELGLGMGGTGDGLQSMLGGMNGYGGFGRYGDGNGYGYGVAQEHVDLDMTVDQMNVAAMNWGFSDTGVYQAGWNRML